MVTIGRVSFAIPFLEVGRGSCRVLLPSQLLDETSPAFNTCDIASGLHLVDPFVERLDTAVF